MDRKEDIKQVGSPTNARRRRRKHCSIRRCHSAHRMMFGASTNRLASSELASLAAPSAMPLSSPSDIPHIAEKDLSR